MAIKSIIGFVKTLKKFPRNKSFEYYYRGHADCNYTLLPSIYRGRHISNEDKIFKEIILRTPSEFSNERTAIEKLVKMQHYGLPTRLLDITSNPLVALYFACSQSKNDGEVLVFKVPKSEIKYYDSDTVTILSNLAKRPIDFDITRQLEIYQSTELCREYGIDDSFSWFNEQDCIAYLLHEIKDEKPQFLPLINPDDFGRVLTVKVKLNNNRILKQSGAFFLFGVENKKSQPAIIPTDWILNNSFKHFDFKIDNSEKEKILEDLNVMGINDSTMFPELEQQAQYVKN
ncbi:MAG: FRG domain-containing protein [Cytophagales bacterium]|nr:FRG domain-containing protein [Cytophagales bacterium]